jgi:amidohydrolase
MTDYLTESKNLFNYTQTLRRDFHSHPELGFEEFRTSKIITRELHATGMDEIKTEIAKTGVVALLKGARPGPVVLLRFDMDALPIEEINETEYSSKHEGVMHACGHDGHIAVGLTVAKILAAHKNELAGTVKFVFQPAEEGQGGADLMVKEGVLENPKPDYSLSFHVWNENEVNWFGITPGPIMAAAESFRIAITGKGGHGASPHQTIDPVYAASQIVTALQSIVSRNVNPLESAVVSVGSLKGGTAFNIIPPDIEIKGTIRTFKADVRALVLKRLCEIVEGISNSLGCESEIEFGPVIHAVSNDKALTQHVKNVTSKLFPESTIDSNACTMGSEDFSFMVRDVPGCYIFVGSANHEKGLDAKHHHPQFDFDESALVNAAALLSTVTSEILS